MVVYCNHCMAKISESERVCSFCGHEITKECPAHHLLPGTILNRKFYVGEAIGEGGFGITYVGRDITLDMKVAIKEYFPNGYVNRSNTISPTVNASVTNGRKAFFEKGRERFLNEARILAKFSGEPGIVEVRDFLEENNTAYIIMEFLDGVDLKHYLSQNGTLTADRTIKMLMPVMKSLKKVHDQGLIHRDISPDNIMLVGDKVKLLDFGAARSASAAANKSLSVMLKPGYAPEEQYRSRGNQGPWTDIYALCATMYKCITGITPDDATQRVFSDEVKTPSALEVSIPKAIETAIMRGMSVQQKDRYQNIDDLIRGLQGINIEFNTADETVAVRRDVSEDDIETRYVLCEDDKPTVYVNDSANSQSVSLKNQTAQENSREANLSQAQTLPLPAKRRTETGKIVGRLAVDKSAITDTNFSQEQFSNPIELKMPDNKSFKFDLIDRVNWNGTEYLIVARDVDVNSLIFFIFKNPAGTANPPVFIPSGKNVKRIYRAFMADHRNEFLFSDEDEISPHIQPRKSDKPREFTENTALGMFGRHLPDVISIPAKYASIGSNVFRYTQGSYLNKQVSKLIIPDSVKQIDSFAFYDIWIKGQIVIPNSVSNIGALAFNLKKTGYIVCEEDSYAYRYAVENGLRNSVDIVKEYRQKGLCQYCGGEFKKRFLHVAVCERCGRDKDY